MSKLNETQLDTFLSARAADGQVHVVHGPNGEYTVSYIVTNVVEGDIVGLSVAAAIARRNPADNFCRRIGRTISKGRLLDGKNAVVNLYQDLDRMPETAEEWRALDAWACSQFPVPEQE